MTDEVCAALEAFRDVLYGRVYLTETVTQAFDRLAASSSFCGSISWRTRSASAPCITKVTPTSRIGAVTDFVTGMTDRYALRLF